MVHLLLVSPCGLLVGVALGVGVVGVDFAAGGLSWWRFFWLAAAMARGVFGAGSGFPVGWCAVGVGLWILDTFLISPNFLRP